MKNVTISMAEADLARVRSQAGAEGISVSKWLARRIQAETDNTPDLETEMLAVLATPLTAMSDGGRTFNRDEIYDRRVFKRFR